MTVRSRSGFWSDRQAGTGYERSRDTRTASVHLAVQMEPEVVGFVSGAATRAAPRQDRARP